MHSNIEVVTVHNHFIRRSMVNSKNKGGNWERKIAKQLSLWISNGKDDSWVWRTASSGGRSTQRSKNGLTTAGGSGDLTFTDSRAEHFFNIFSVELKCGYQETNPLMEIDSNSKTHPFRENLQQAINDAKLSNKEPMLIIKRDRMNPCVCFLKSRYTRMVGTFGDLKFDVKYLEFWNGTDKFIIFKLDDFLDWANPEYFENL